MRRCYLPKTISKLLEFFYHCLLSFSPLLLPLPSTSPPPSPLLLLPLPSISIRLLSELTHQVEVSSREVSQLQQRVDHAHSRGAEEREQGVRAQEEHLKSKKTKKNDFFSCHLADLKVVSKLCFISCSA